MLQCFCQTNDGWIDASVDQLFSQVARVHWLHITLPLTQEDQALLNSLKITKSIGALLERPSRMAPMAMTFTGHLIGKLDFFIDEVEDKPLRFIVGQSYIITVTESGQVEQAVKKYFKRIVSDAGNVWSILASLFELICSKMDKKTTLLDEALDQLEAHVLSYSAAKLQGNLLVKRRELIELRHAFAPMREALQRIIVKLPQENEALLHALRSLAYMLGNLVQDIEALRERANVIQEQLASKISMDLNNRMYLLTVISVVFMPLSFVAGLLGMNVAGIPFDKVPWGFWGITGGLGVLAIVLAWVLLKSRWFQ